MQKVKHWKGYHIRLNPQTDMMVRDLAASYEWSINYLLVKLINSGLTQHPAKRKG